MDNLFADVLLEFLSACEGCANQAQLVGAIEKVNRHLGIDYFAMSFLPLAHEPLDAYFIWDRWPRAWFERYVQHNYFHSDPIVALVRNSGRACVWSESVAPSALTKKAKRIMNEAGDFGLLDGVTIPLHSRTGLRALFSVAGDREPMEPREVNLLQIVAESAHHRLVELGPARPDALGDPHITRSESECLTMCAAGLTDKEIGRKTYRSQRTVQAHLRNLQHKLGAANRAQLIAEAFRRGFQR